MIDLFAGPGGWDVAAKRLGLDPIGLEWDDAACATRRAAGLRTMQCDVGAVDLTAPVVGWPGTRVWGLIASPPCQAFSMAGKGAGRGAMEAYSAAISQMASGLPVDIAALDEASGDPRGHLVLEPLRWALALKPRWIACEQVEPVMPLWESTALALQLHGYQTWHGVLSSEQYGVPQTRRRAILLASLDGRPERPAPTHQRYIAPRRRDEQEASLFDAPEPERIVHPEDAGLLPWVSMAQALGWEEGPSPSPSPSPSVTGGGGATGGVEVFASKGSRGRALRAVAFKANAQANAAVRPLDAPAPTITGGHDGAERVWVHERPAPTIVTTRRSSEGLIVGRQLPPGEGRNIGGHGWTEDRPATTVAGDPRVHPPGHKVNGDDLAAGRTDYEGRAGQNAIRVTPEQAAILQSFPPGYPWQGSKTKVHEQIGNAVPPGMAEAILRTVVAAVDALAVAA